MYNQQIRFCTSDEGVRIAYAQAGSGAPLVMSATWLTHLEHQWRSLAWKPWLESLSRDHQLLRYDPRGCGLSDRDVRDISFETWVRDFETVVDAAGYERFPLLGVCQGGPIAIEYAARHPERVSHLVLYGTYARGRAKRDDAPSELKKAEVLLNLTRLGWGQENHAFVQVWASQFQPGGSLEHLRSWCELQQASTSAETAVRLMSETFNIDVRSAAQQVRCPTLIIHPDRGAVVPLEEARILASLISGSRFVQLDSENQMPLPEEPAWPRLLEELRRFLPHSAVKPSSAEVSSRLGTLTKREREVLEEIAQGQSNSQIAARLNLSEKTVRNHITHILDKMDMMHRYQAIVAARELGLGSTQHTPAH